MSLYFDTNTFAAKPNNAGLTGFNDWSVNYNPDANGDNKLSSLGITAATSWTYAQLISNIASTSELTANVDGNGVYTNVLFDLQQAGQISNVQRVELIRLCAKCITDSIYISWVNSKGGYDYLLFKDRIEQTVNSQDTLQVENYVSELATTNKKNYTFYGKSLKSYKVFKSGIQKHAYVIGTKINNLH